MNVELGGGDDGVVVKVLVHTLYCEGFNPEPHPSVSWLPYLSVSKYKALQLLGGMSCGSCFGLDATSY